jgi:hypothetical protein
MPAQASMTFCGTTPRSRYAGIHITSLSINLKLCKSQNLQIQRLSCSVLGLSSLIFGLRISTVLRLQNTFCNVLAELLQAQSIPRHSISELQIYVFECCSSSLLLADIIPDGYCHQYQFCCIFIIKIPLVRQVLKHLQFFL